MDWISFPVSTDGYFIWDSKGHMVASRNMGSGEPIPRGWGYIGYLKNRDTVWEQWETIWSEHGLSNLTLLAITNYLNQLQSV